jgi:uncharacterized membrane protein YraQ (UPF0718 family)
MLTAGLFIWSLAAAMALVVQLKDPSRHRDAIGHGWTQLKSIVVRVPLTLLAATYALTLIPQDHMASLLGDSSGMKGILLANLFGAALPGGPLVTFPVIVVLREHGVGDAQTVALLTAWSVLALHRVLAFELPILGGRFVAVRLAASALLPLVAGALAGLCWLLLERL